MSTMPQSRQEVLALLRLFMQREQAEYGLISLGIFGSVARDEARSDSDVDIVFETSKPNLFLTAKMRIELEELLARPVDVVRLRERMNPRLKERILREALYV